MENFTNETIDTKQLPRFEEVQLSALHPKYWIVSLMNTTIVFFVLGIVLGFVWYNAEEFSHVGIYFLLAYLLILAIAFLLTRIGFKKKGFAFREHDVIYRSGIIATNTMVIPYNRVQHVALHEGLISRYFGLAKVEIFTAGGSSSDVEIPGIAKEEAENIKQLLMGKIQKQL
ncbi:PH domain-containing protein [Flavobacterium sp.]|uniref:PH domain-containing protein n=1 Tax=Flavobacterium sp. TaxID=239 RepID=UPI002B4B3826|nr:PH domain-containing protein [Flavobacterium sp.]HLP64814.1 PH domain-containing protein [Flavobacterium sp.]